MIRSAWHRADTVRGQLKQLHHVQLKDGHYRFYRAFHATAYTRATGLKDGENASPLPQVVPDQHRSSFFPAQNQFMITTTAPGVTKTTDIISRVSNIFSNSKEPLAVSFYPPIVVLATPSFATWLEDDHFMSKIFDSLFSGYGVGSVTALLAIVDGLPVGHPLATSTDRSTEGFAFLRCRDEQFLPGLFTQKAASSMNSGDQHPRLSFTMGKTMFGLHTELPLANTLFRNGRPSTLLATKWQKTKVAEPFRKQTQLEKSSQLIYNPDFENPWLSVDIPLTALTAPRQIVSGLGNIVRQITGPEGLPISASKELEVAVDLHIQETQVEKHAVAVWALVSPDDGNPPSEITNEALQYLLFKRGGSLHRVLSGGGGWGPKQGLLSLDPENTLADAVDARYDFDMLEPFNNDKVEALGNIARPGSWVQFLTSPVKPNDDDKINNSSKNDSEGAAFSDLLLGCIPSSIDDIPVDMSNTTENSEENRPNVETLLGRFGAQSEKGVYIRIIPESQNPTPQREFPIRTKIDVPFSHVRWGDDRDLQTRKPVPS